MSSQITPNPWVQKLDAYVPGEQPREAGFVKLNTNESPYPAPASVIDAVCRECEAGTLNKYPDPNCTAVRESLAEITGVPYGQILAGNGSDEVLRLVCHAYLNCAAGDQVGMLWPTYSLYSVLAEMFGASVRRYSVAEPDYVISDEAANARVKVFFLANPNPPIGTAYSADVIRKMATAQPDRLLIVDEAYVDFAESDAMPVYAECPNIVITRTFSKSFSLAGARFGYLIAREPIISELEKVKDSYNVNRLTQAAALAATKERSYFRDMAKRIIGDREYLISELRKRGFTIPASRGNFVFARRHDAQQLYERLKARRILVRYFRNPELADGLRISIGTRKDLDALLAGIDALAVA